MQQECTSLDSRAFGFAAGTTAAALSAVCALFLVLAPQATRALLGYLIHSDVRDLPVAVTWASAIGSVVGWGLGVGLVFSAAAVLYNRFQNTARTEPKSAPIRAVS